MITNTKKGIEPVYFNLLLFLLSVSMMFAGFTSAYVVRESQGKWLDFDLPNFLWLSTAVAIISSVTMQLAFNKAKKDKKDHITGLVLITFLLGLVFLYTQFMSFVEIYNYDYKIVFGGKQSNPSGSFFYVFVFIHALHIIGGIIFLLFLLIKSLLKEVHSNNMLNIRMCKTYWHFLGGLWLYLFIFLLFNHLK